VAAAGRAWPGGSVSSGLAFSGDDDDFDDLGYRTGRGPSGRTRRRLLASRRSRLGAWLVVAVVLVLGTRDVLGSALPLVGQFLPFPSWTTAWHDLVAAWQPAGVGSSAPASPAFGVLAVLGTVLFGRMELLQEVLVLGCVPVGAWGLSRLLRPFGSPRARFAGVVCYLALPLAYDAFARGRWDGLVAYAATPWVVLLLARSSGLAPFDAAGGSSGPVRAWHGPWWRRVAALGAVEALGVSFAPAMALVVLVAALGIAAGSVLVGGRRGGLRALAAGAGATVVAAVLCLPWSVATIAAGRSALSVFGLAGTPASSPGWGGLLRMAVGPIGGSPLSWLLLAAAVSPLLVARQVRLEWAGRLWAVGLSGWLLALVASKGWASPFAPSVDVMLAPAAVAVACGAGLGVAAFESDLSGYRFGWRQLVAVVSVAAIVVGLLPTLTEATNGQWGLPTVGYGEALPFATASADAGYRVLWLGDPRVLPLGAWPIGPGLAYATSVDGNPDLADLWVPAAPGRASALGSAVGLAMRGETVTLGRLLAADQVRYVVVVSGLAPEVPGVQQTVAFPPPAGTVGALTRQQDLATVQVGADGFAVFENTAFTGVPVTAVTRAPPGGSQPLDPLGAAAELVAWALLAVALLGRRRWIDWWWAPLRSRLGGPRRRPRSAPDEAAPDETAPDETAPDETAPVEAAPVAMPVPARVAVDQRATPG
jgi:hypothetical protein